LKTTRIIHAALVAIAIFLATPQASRAADDFFADEILVRGKNLSINRPELDKAYLQFKANATLRNQPIPADRRAELEANLLDRIVVTHLMLQRASEADKEIARKQADEFVAKVIREAGSETAFNRQLIALGFTREDFTRQVLDRATCEAFVERELHGKVQVSEDDIQSFYKTNQAKLQRPEMAQAQHIFFSTRNPETGTEISSEAKTDKLQKAKTALQRARQNEDFPTLVLEFSEDQHSRDRQGEYIFSRGQADPAFENAAFQLKPGEISDIVTSSVGLHILKLIQIIPGETIPLDQLRDEIRLKITREKVQTEVIPDFLEQLKKEASLEYLNGARPPSKPSNAQSLQ
jgi:parvulin-like peptidyl-prolyl isomerase